LDRYAVGMRLELAYSRDLRVLHVADSIIRAVFSKSIFASRLWFLWLL